MSNTPIEWLVAGAVAGLLLLAVTLWSARRYENALAAYRMQLRHADELQQRETDLLHHQEAILKRIEAIVARFEKGGPT